MTDDAIRPTIERAEGMHVVRAGGAVLAESANALSVSLPDEDEPAIYFPQGEAGETFMDRTEIVFEIPGLGRARQYDIVAKSGPISSAAWVIETPADGAEALADHFAFDTERVAVERI